MKDKEKATDYFNSILEKNGRFLVGCSYLQYFLFAENPAISTTLE